MFVFPQLANSGAMLFLVSLNAAGVSEWTLTEIDYLSDPEQARLARIQHAQTRLQYWLSRVMVKQALAQWIGVTPQDIAFDITSAGRPYLKTSPFDSLGGDARLAKRLNVNWSHCGDWVVLAVTEQGTVGVDAEWAERTPDMMALAQRFFHPDEAAYLATLKDASSDDALKNAFFQLWTAKEAYVKALGTGLQTPLDHFCVDMSAHRPQSWLGWSAPERQALSSNAEVLPLTTVGHAMIHPAKAPISNGVKLPRLPVHYWQWGSALHVSLVHLSETDHLSETEAPVEIWHFQAPSQCERIF